MITKEQIDYLAKFYRIDSFTIIREYLQLIFLSYLYKKKEGKKIFFKGGTAIRLLLGSSRFSEDLDFSTTLGKEKIKNIIQEVGREMNQEIPSIKIILLYSGKNTERYRIKYQGKETKYPLAIRLDFHREKNIEDKEVSPLITKFPIVFFPLVSHLTKEMILKEKLQALISRAKPRDIFDVWFLMKKGIRIKGKFNKALIQKKIKNMSQRRIEKELNKFLPIFQRPIIKNLKEELLNLLSP